MLSHTWEGIYLQVGLMGQKIKTYAILPGISEFSLGVVPFCILQVIYEKAWVSTALTTKCLPHFWIWANMSKRWNSSLVFIYTYLIRGLPSMGSHRVKHDWSDLAAAALWVRLSICSGLKAISLSLSLNCVHIVFFCQAFGLFLLNFKSLS